MKKLQDYKQAAQRETSPKGFEVHHCLLEVEQNIAEQRRGCANVK